MNPTPSAWTSRRPRLPRRSRLNSLALAASLLSAPAALSQPATNAQRQTPAFEVASIRPHLGPLHVMAGFSSSGPRLTLEGYNLRMLVMEAYGLRSYQVSMAASVSQQDVYYDVGATAGGESAPTKSEFREMLKGLLADRFQLKVHTEKRQLPVYSLVVGKGGPKLSPPSESVRQLLGVNGRNQFIQAGKITMDELANQIWYGLLSERPILDRTGLTGSYRVRLEATPQFRMNRDPQPGDLGIFTAVQEQLGLKLEPSTSELDILVVDSAQKPSEN